VEGLAFTFFILFAAWMQEDEAHDRNGAIIKIVPRDSSSNSTGHSIKKMGQWSRDRKKNPASKDRTSQNGKRKGAAMPHCYNTPARFHVVSAQRRSGAGRIHCQNGHREIEEQDEQTGKKYVSVVTIRRGRVEIVEELKKSRPWQRAGASMSCGFDVAFALQTTAEVVAVAITSATLDNFWLVP